MDFNIDLVSFDVKDLEGLNRTLNNLEKIQKAFNQVQGIVQGKVYQQQQKIKELIDRIKMCKRKILALKNQKVALQIYSPAEFPTKYKFTKEDREGIYSSFEKTNCKQILQSEEFAPKIMSHKKSEGKYQEIARDDLSQMLITTYSKFVQKRKNILEGKNSITRKLQNKKQSLGQVPRNLKYCDNLLIFNSDQNPYKHYQPVDNLKIHKKNLKKPKKAKEPENYIDLYNAPQTLGEKERLQQYSGLDGYYKPTAKAAPQIQLDQGLDDYLGGVVQLDVEQGDDMQFLPSQGGAYQGASKQVKDYNQNYQEKAQTQQPVQQIQNNLNNQQQPQQQQPQQQSNQPPSLNSLQQQSQTNQPPSLSSLQNQTAQNNNNNPPKLQQLQSQTPQGNNNNNQQAIAQPAQPAQTNKDAQSAAPPSGGGGRNALLDEIRNPKVKLRKRVVKESGGINVGKKKITDKAGNEVSSENAADGGQGESKPKPAAGGGSIMDQLQRQIQLRYKALHPEDEKKPKKKIKQLDSDDDEDEEDSD
ncbi:hypothetical protein PPERSA_03578 [Pseudocohnilembus persalinus]|uniref:WH2 domain-containing protein n=1 Tax=Pseudocohnilembus persalinus TaxID=266149 RepID=A0A0V0QPZ0_PSEPJ|nr:hypothetical protein PPERSA_03578 [Pseudocohnilembus persalinus]|eukprot:KRX04338.1 hypothetical protein PPERSA_03578 [Pseudocohnilembus persalinus]